MNYPSVWSNQLKIDGVQRHLLVTFVFSKDAASLARKTKRHLATSPGALRLTTADGLIVPHSGNEYYFKPGICEWIEMEDSVDPIRREIDDIEARIIMTSDVDFPVEELQPGGSGAVTVRVDLWANGIELNKVIKLFEGRVRKAEYSSRDGSIQVDAIDGKPVRQTRFPPGDNTLNSDFFPRIPIHVAGRFSRQVILGAFDYPVTCVQVDEGRTFYVCDHLFHRVPDTVQVNGEVVSSTEWNVIKERVATALTANENDGYVSLIRFNKALNLEVPYVTCSGGVGLNLGKSPALLLLENYGRYEVSKSAKDILNRAEFNQSVLTKASADVLDIVMDRLVPQTNHMMGFRGGEVVLLPLSGVRKNINLKVGGNMIGRADGAIEESPDSQVYNAIKVKYERNPWSVSESDFARREYRLDFSRVTGKLRHDLETSERRYGRKELEFPMPDTYVRDPNVIPTVVKDAARILLTNLNKQREIFDYYVDYDYGLDIDTNDIIKVTDEIEEFEDRPMRVIARTLLANCVMLKMMNED